MSSPMRSILLRSWTRRRPKRRRRPSAAVTVSLSTEMSGHAALLGRLLQHGGGWGRSCR